LNVQSQHFLFSPLCILPETQNPTIAMIGLAISISLVEGELFLSAFKFLLHRIHDEVENHLRVEGKVRLRQLRVMSASSISSSPHLYLVT